MSRQQAAAECFKCGYNCAQSVFSAIAPEFDVDYETALKVAGAFGGGMGRMGETCGVVTGAFMAIGLKYSKTKFGEETQRDKGYELVREFTKRFEDKYGSITCRDLLKEDIGSPEGRERINALNLHRDVCYKLVQDSISMVEDLLELNKD
jgi:C_GCAxxG_C_C family probable redox protein